MAIEIKPTLQNTVSDISPRTVPPSLDTDVKKVTPEPQETQVTKPEVSVTNDRQPVELNKEKLDAMVSKLNDFVEQQKREIRFSVDEDTNKTVVRLLDSNGDVLKQIPSEEVLAILKGIESNKGIFLEDEA